MTDKPLTLLRLHEVITSHLASKVQTLHVLLANGIMDFLVAQKEQASQDSNFKRQIEMQLFKSSVFSPSSNELQPKGDSSSGAANADGGD